MLQSAIPRAYAEVQDADGKVLVKTDGSASSGVTAQQGTLMPARTEVAAPVKSHPRVAMWCAQYAASHPAFIESRRVVRC